MENLTNFEDAVKGSFYTITGVDGYNKMLSEAGITTPKTWYTFKGKDMNETYSLTGNKAYDNDLTFLAFPLTGIEPMGKLAMFKMQNGDRWFDDIVSNNARN